MVDFREGASLKVRCSFGGKARGGGFGCFGAEEGSCVETRDWLSSKHRNYEESFDDLPHLRTLPFPLLQHLSLLEDSRSTPTVS